MEENIKVLEELINKCKECKFATCEQCEINWKQVQAIENLIKRNKELEEKVNKYEKQIDLEWVENNYIEKSKYDEVIKRNKELENTTLLISPYYVTENYIPKSKVREFFEKSKVVKNESKDKTYLLIDVSELNEELLQERDDK